MIGYRNETSTVFEEIKYGFFDFMKIIGKIFVYCLLVGPVIMIVFAILVRCGIIK